MQNEESNKEQITLAIFGATGDLARRKLVPSLYRLWQKGRLPENLRVVGISRTELTTDQFRQDMREAVTRFSTAPLDATSWSAFEKMLGYFAGDFSSPGWFAAFAEWLGKSGSLPGSLLFYLATGPDLFGPIAQGLGEAGLAEEKAGWRRLVVEKPFGRDLASARTLNQTLNGVFREDQIYRIDHYLGKETAQNILFFRFANTIFEPVWDRRYVDNIQITVAESVDVEHRAAYYDRSGVFRDMFQNHMLQLLALVTMEPPAFFGADTVRNEKVKVLRAIRDIDFADTVAAQYEGYRSTPGVAENSRAPTYAALRLFVDNWRWKGVPFYLRSGKALKRKATEIVVEFQCPPHVMFDLPPGSALPANVLSLCIQPDEGIHLSFITKVPDSLQRAQPVDMQFHYRSSFAGEELPDAYERLLLDALHGDASLFTRSDAIELGWKLFDPVIRRWENPEGPPLPTYERASWGPQAASQLLARDSRRWRLGCVHRR